MDAFVENYDKMVGADYDRISDFIIRAIEKYKPDSSLICDLGCGTGKVIDKLSRQGFDMIGIDSNEDMLIIARETFASNNISDVLLLEQDITEFELYGTVDAIYSTLDTVNYITCKRKLDKFFKLVRNYLNFDGLFIFDVNTEYKFKEVLDGNDFIYDNDDLFCCWSAEFDKKSEKCYHWLTYFEKTENGMFIRRDTQQLQRFYSEEHLSLLFNKYGFDVLGRFDDYTCRKVNAKSERITYVLRINK